MMAGWSFHRPRGRAVSGITATLFAAFAAGTITPALAAEQGLTLSDAWIRSIIASRPAAGYFTLKNDGDADRSLVAAQSPGCGMVMLHQSIGENGVDKMVMVKSVDVPAHGSASFAPGGYHLMCMQPTAAVEPRKSVPVTLKFGDGGSMTADFPVRNAAGD